MPSGSNRIPLRLVPIVASLILSGATEIDAQTLRGSRASVDRIHRQALSHQLHFYETSSGVRRAHDRGVFVRLGGNANYALANVSHPYVLPATHTFILRLAQQYRSACGEKLVVTSAMRPKSLRLVNSVDRSVHPTGMAVDLRRPTNGRCLSWLRETLLNLESTGAIEAVEERNPPHFHVAVFPTPYTRYVQRQGGTVRVAAAPNAAQGRSIASVAAAERTYQVRRGDSLWSIARRNNVSVDHIRQANDLRSTRIVAGQVLKIPEAK